MEWTHEVPKKEGLYLRSNPSLANFRASMEWVHEIEGEMCIAGEGINMVRLSKWGGAPHFLWYGPIEPPTEYKK